MTLTNSELREQILDCFKRTKMQQEGDTELFDTDLTIDLIEALIDKQVIEAYGKGYEEGRNHLKDTLKDKDSK